MAKTLQAPPIRRGFAVVDVETTGLDATSHRVIEIAVALVDVTGAVEREWSSLVRVKGDTGPVHIHGLTTAHLAQSPSFRQILPTLCELLDGRILVAHNAEFDWGFLSHEAARAGGALPVQERLCTVHLARRLNTDATNYKLSTLAAHWKIDPGTAHRAEDDVRTLVNVLGRCLDEAARQQAVLPLEECAAPEGLKWRIIRALNAFRYRSLPSQRAGRGLD